VDGLLLGRESEVFKVELAAGFNAGLGAPFKGRFTGGFNASKSAFARLEYWR